MLNSCPMAWIRTARWCCFWRVPLSCAVRASPGTLSRDGLACSPTDEREARHAFFFLCVTVTGRTYDYVCVSCTVEWDKPFFFTCIKTREMLTSG